MNTRNNIFHEITHRPINKLDLANRCPTFILSDISGDASSVAKLAQCLEQLTENQIYLSHNPTQATSLVAEANFVVSQIRAILDDILKTHKIIISSIKLAGYSKGGSLGFLVAQQLITQGIKVAFINIDSPDFEASQNFYVPNNKSATQKLTSIFRYLAKLAGRLSNTDANNLLKFSDSETDNIIQLPIKDQLEYFKKKLDESILDEETKKSCAMYCDSSTRGMLNILEHHEIDHDQTIEEKSSSAAHIALPQLPRMYVLYSAEVKHDYGDIVKNWSAYCDSIEGKEIPHATHGSLMNEHAHLVATEMINYWNKNISQEELAIMGLQTLRLQFQGINLAHLLQSMPQSEFRTLSPTASLSSSPTPSECSSASSVSNSPSFNQSSESFGSQTVDSLSLRMDLSASPLTLDNLSPRRGSKRCQSTDPHDPKKPKFAHHQATRSHSNPGPSPSSYSLSNMSSQSSAAARNSFSFGDNQTSLFSGSSSSSSSSLLQPNTNAAMSHSSNPLTRYRTRHWELSQQSDTPLHSRGDTTNKRPSSSLGERPSSSLGERPSSSLGRSRRK